MQEPVEAPKELSEREAGGGRGKEEGGGTPKACPSTNSHRIEPHCQCLDHLQPTASSPLH